MEETIESQTRLLVDLLQKEMASITILKEEMSFLKEKMKWRKYSDQKPDENGYYLVANVKSRHFNDIAWYSKDEDWFHEVGRGTPREITHWMPLPTPPKDD